MPNQQHKAKELRYWAALLAADGSTVINAAVGANVEDLAGRRLEQAQLIAAETSHMILMHAEDAAVLPAQGYVQIDGTLYLVDYTQDPRNPRPNMWTEIYCHVERSGN
jgi:hypothetical protein